MLFSKSFGYAVRSVLYVASVQNEKQHVPLKEITSKLNLPKQFMGRILKVLVKEGVLTSIKGPHGGFSIGKEGMQLPLLKLLEITDGNMLGNCVLKKKQCNPGNPCPVHNRFTKILEDLKLAMSNTSIKELVKGNHPDFVKSLSETNGRKK